MKSLTKRLRSRNNFLRADQSLFKVPGSSYMRLEDALELKNATLPLFEDAVNNFLELHNVQVTQYQFDVLVYL